MTNIKSHSSVLLVPKNHGFVGKLVPRMIDIVLYGPSRFRPAVPVVLDSTALYATYAIETKKPILSRLPLTLTPCAGFAERLYYHSSMFFLFLR